MKLLIILNINTFGSHAIIKLNDNILVEFYKKSVYVYNKTTKSNDICELILNNLIYECDDITFEAFNLDSTNTIFYYELNYKNDIYAVVIGSSIGKGYDNTLTSKYLKKCIIYNKRKSTYFIDNEYNQIDYYINKDYKKFLKHELKEFRFKTFI